MNDTSDEEERLIVGRVLRVGHSQDQSMVLLATSSLLHGRLQAVTLGIPVQFIDEVTVAMLAARGTLPEWIAHTLPAAPPMLPATHPEAEATASTNPTEPTAHIAMRVRVAGAPLQLQLSLRDAHALQAALARALGK